MGHLLGKDVSLVDIAIFFLSVKKKKKNALHIP